MMESVPFIATDITAADRGVEQRRGTFFALTFSASCFATTGEMLLMSIQKSAPLFDAPRARRSRRPQHLCPHRANQATS